MRLLSLALLPLASAASLILQPPTHTTRNWEWTSCGTSDDIVRVDSIELSPDPPQPGKDLTVTAKGHVFETIQDGAYADVLVKLGVIKLLSKRFDVCEEAKNNNATIQCPVSEDDHTVVQTVALPKEIPRAKFVVHVEGYTVDEEPMLCLDIKIDFMRRFFKDLHF